jgi:hypothetical protein
MSWEPPERPVRDFIWDVLLAVSIAFLIYITTHGVD